MSNPYPVDSATRPCCGAIGDHTPACNSATFMPVITECQQVPDER